MDLNLISESLQKGNAQKVKTFVQQAIDEGMEPKKILEEGLLSGMGIIGQKFKNNEIFVPEVLISARAMNAGTQILESVLVDDDRENLGKVVIGTVKGDLHDIGKNLVIMMMKGAGLDVIDLGTNVEVNTFIEEAEKHDAKIICMSALLTTTMPYMESVITALEDQKIREKYTVMVGGAPLTGDFAKKVGADLYTKDAMSAAEAAKKVLTQ